MIVMNLIYFNLIESKKVIYLDNIQLIDFFKFIGEEKIVHLSVFFGYNPNSYFYESDLPPNLSLKGLLSFIDENKISIISDISFEIDNTQFKINDCHEFNIEGNSLTKEFIQKIMSHFTGLNICDEKMQELQNKYLLIQKASIVNVFKTFDEYIEADC